MKKIYLSAVLLGAITSVSAQKMERSTVSLAEDYKMEIAEEFETSVQPKELGAEIWVDNFDNGANWVLTNSSVSNPGYSLPNYGWNIGSTVNSWWNSFSTGINSTSGGGFAEVYNGDFFAETVDSTNEVLYRMTSIPIDIPNLPLNASSAESVIFSFEQFGALFNDGQTVEISTDGTIWNEIYTNNNRTTFVGNNPDAVYVNPEEIQINVSSYTVGNANSVLFRFSWTSRFGISSPAPTTSKNGWTTFGWFIDDVKILSLPNDNVQIVSSYIFGVTNEGAEYGRTPLNQLDPDWIIGSSVYNAGSIDQPTTMLTADFGTFTANASGLVESDSTRAVETTQVGLGLTLTSGVYTGNFTVVAGNDTLGDPSFTDNTDSRTFEVTNDVYSLDGIGVYPATSVSQTGTNSFDDNATSGAVENSAGLPLGTMYHIKNATTVSEIEVVFGPSTTTGGEIIVALIDTAVFLSANGGAGAVTPVLVESDAHLISASDSVAGMVRIPLTSQYLLNPGAYYALAILTVYDTDNHTITIADDETIGQPAWNSAFFLKDAIGTNTVRTYTDGNAFAIRLVTGTAGLNENSLNGVNVYPNPTTGKFTVTNENNTENTVAIFDMLGKEVYTNTTSSSLTVDLSANGMGVYLVKVSNENGSIVKRVVIK